jgi:hypothetical protein
MEKVYVVYGEEGSYSDYRMWLVDVCASEQDAEELINLLKEEWALIVKRYPLNPWNHNNPYDNVGSHYAVYNFQEMDFNSYKKIFKGDLL